MPSARLISASIAAALLIAGISAVAILRPPFLEQVAPVFRPAPPPEPPRPYDPLGRLPADLRVMLTAPDFDAPSPFIRVARVMPERFCKSLTAAGLKNAVYQGGEPPMRGWTCVTDLIKPIDGDEQVVSSLFVAMRGLESDRIDNIRMKLNLLDEATSPVARAIARDLLGQICRTLGWEPPPDVVDALDALKEGRVMDHGVSYDLHKEFGVATGARYNLIIIFPRTLGSGGEDRFVTDIRRSPVAR